MVILTTGFGEFEFSRTFSLLLLLYKKCGKIELRFPKSKFKKLQKLREIDIPKLTKSAGNSNSKNVKKCGKIQIPQIL